MWLRLCLAILFLQNVMGMCKDVNVYLDGQVQTSTRERNATACEAKCTSTICQQWSFRGGECSIMKVANPGRKVGEIGATHGGQKSNQAQASNQCSGQVTGITCNYTLTRTPVVCLFPFIGEVPGNKNQTTSHDTCLQTKRGKYWCATKLSLENQLLSTSDQTQDIDCGFAVSAQGQFRCIPSSTPSGCPNMTELGQYIAKLEQENRLLKAQGCNVTSQSSSTASTVTKRPDSPPFNIVTKKPDILPTPVPTLTPRTPARNADPVLGIFTEKLLSVDENNAASFISFNQGCKTRVGNPDDCSSAPLFTTVNGNILNRPIYQKLKALYENYNPDTLQEEDHTRAEQTEEREFLAELMKTRVIQETYAFVKQQNYFKGTQQDFSNLLNELWFSVYSRGMRIKGSSGFEHVFLGEKKEGKVQGFHSWLYFFFLEKRNELNYLGHIKNVDLGGRGNGLAFTFKWGQEQKPFASMIIGTSPELELAIYTTCLLAKGEDKCSVSLGGQKVDVEVHTFSRPNNKKFIASSFFDF
jgi:poly(U)-specific endoribonuclease